MSTAADGIVVRSHVARDLLQSAALFKTDKLVVWEYVSNGLQYVDPGVNPHVSVHLDSKRKRIVIIDNGSGMDWGGLQNYFVMHGENIDRKHGRAGRGRFGTGKSAAFGIAGRLRITTVRGNKRSKVELSRLDVEHTGSGGPIPVRQLEREVAVTQPNGTTVEIEEIHLRSLDQAGIIHYMEKQLARWPKNISVFVNNHECEYNEPPVTRELTFQPDQRSSGKLGNIELLIKVAKRPLDQDERGVSIFSKGVWYETTLAGNEGKEMSQYIFGEVDIPALDEDKSPIPPFDMSRSMVLNPSNELVQIIYTFVSECVEKVRYSLVQEEKQRRQTEEAKKLEKAASEIAKFLNEDFDAFRHKLAKVKAKSLGGGDINKYMNGGDDDAIDLVFGKEQPAELVDPVGGPGSPPPADIPIDTPGKIPDLAPQVQSSDAAEQKIGRPSGGAGERPRTRGGFNINVTPSFFRTSQK